MTDLVDSAADRGPTKPENPIRTSTTGMSTVGHQPASRRERRAIESAAPAIPAAPVAVPAAVRVIPATAAPAAPRPGIKSRVSAIGTMAAVVAIFGVFALPAYAMDVSATETADDVEAAVAQTVTVDEDALLATGVRDGYAATSYAEYLEAQAEVLRLSYGLSPAIAGDDYPFRGQYGLSALGYYMGQCTDFVAWRLNRDAGSVGAPWKYTWSMMTPSGGDAEQWLSAWQAHGWPVSTTPMAGAVAWFGGNHVGYVKEVYADGSFMVEDYNRVAYETYAREIFAPGSIPYFLYPPG